MKKKGDYSVGYGYIITGVIAALIVVGYFTGFFPWFGKLIGIADLIPVLGLGEPVKGNGIVGLSLSTGNFEYYNGERFKSFNDQKVSTLAGYEFNVADTKQKISDFYFKTERRPEKLVIEINHWRYWEVINGGSKDLSFIINFENKDSFEKDGLEESYEYAELDSYGKPKIFSSYDWSTFPSFAKLEFEENDNKIVDMVAWKDSFLQGNKCEKFLTLKVKQNGTEKDMIYAVRKSEGYLVIDLTSPVSPGTIQKWDNSECFEYNSYIDVKKEITDFSLSFEFNDAAMDKSLIFVFEHSTGWKFPDSEYRSGSILSDIIGLPRSKTQKYILDRETENSLIKGILKIIETGGENIQGFKFLVEGKVIYQRENFSKNSLKHKDQIVYEIMDAYNKILALEVN